jgi:UDP-N-acetylmuramoylalanine--D-glutamate ligase
MPKADPPQCAGERFTLQYENKMRREDRIKGKKVCVFGMARSGLAVASLLKKYSGDVFVTDVKNSPFLAKETEELKKLGIEYEIGGHSHNSIKDKDFLVISPGVSFDIPILLEAQEKGIPIFSEVEVAFWLNQAFIVGITGTNGKTTTATLIGEILKEDKREVKVAGNIGVPFSSVVEEVSSDGIIVLELSSFQLEKIEEFHPKVASILNITPDHLDRYSDFKSYKDAKLRIFENQTEEDFAVLNFDDDESRGIENFSKGEKIFFSTINELDPGVFLKDGSLIFSAGGGSFGIFEGKKEKIIEATQIGIKGPHNLSNAACASAISLILGVKLGSIRNALQNFKGVEHRLEEVSTISGVKFINDSKATNVSSVWYALQSIGRPIILIGGGRDKGGDFTKLRDLVKDKVKALILLGEAKEKMKNELGDLIPTFFVSDMEEAVNLSLEKASSGDSVLLSPGCASFDMFDNFEHRGKVFKSAVEKLKK